MIGTHPMRSIAQDRWKCVRRDEVNLETLGANTVGTTMHVSSASVFILVQICISNIPDIARKAGRTRDVINNFANHNEVRELPVATKDKCFAGWMQ